MEERIYDELKYVIAADNKTEFYDQITYVLETLRQFNILDYEAYEEAEEKLEKIFKEGK